MDTHEVDRIVSCHECPYSYPQWRRGGTFVCSHDSALGDDCDDPRRVLAKLSDATPWVPPTWCPLRKQPTLVVLEVSP